MAIDYFFNPTYTGNPKANTSRSNSNASSSASSRESSPRRRSSSASSLGDSPDQRQLQEELRAHLLNRQPDGDMLDLGSSSRGSTTSGPPSIFTPTSASDSDEEGGTRLLDRSSRGRSPVRQGSHDEDGLPWLGRSPGRETERSSRHFSTSRRSSPDRTLHAPESSGPVSKLLWPGKASKKED